MVTHESRISSAVYQNLV